MEKEKWHDTDNSLATFNQILTISRADKGNIGHIFFKGSFRPKLAQLYLLEQ